MLAVLLAAMAATTGAAVDLDVPVTDPVYALLDDAWTRGALDEPLFFRPVSRERCLALLRRAAAREAQLGSERAAQVAADITRLAVSPGLLAASVESSVRADVARADSVDFRSSFGARFSGELLDNLAWSVDADLRLDRARHGSWEPFTYTKDWDGFHMWYGTDKYSADAETQAISGRPLTHPVLGGATATQLLWSPAGTGARVALSRERRSWSTGDDSLVLGSGARPFLALEAVTPLAPGVTFGWLSGSLGDWTDPGRSQKMISVHGLVLTPVPWASVSAWEGIVWGKRLELLYLDPFMIYYLAQNILGDRDNAFLGFDAAVRPFPGLALSMSLFVDEIEIDSIGRFFQDVKNQYAFRVGASAALPWAGAAVHLRYTKVEPYCYTHYLQSVSYSTSPLDIAYTNDGENLGSPLAPNSDELRVKLAALLGPSRVEAVYRLVRHGDGSLAAGQIQGSIDEPLDYAHLSMYPAKNFLGDGIYAISHCLGLAAALRWGAVDLSLSYSFVATANAGNVAGNDTVGHILALGARCTF